MENDLNRDELLKLLKELHFDERYYALYEQFRDRSGKVIYTQADVMAAVTSTGLDFSYHPREKFYAYKERFSLGTVGLHIAVPNATVEFVLVLEAAGKQIGAPFPALARNVALLKNPAFSYEPRSPKIPFVKIVDLHEIMQQGILLFQDITGAVLARSHTVQP